MADQMNQDECTHCKVRGDFAKCQAAECSKHSTWYAQELQAKLLQAQEACKLAYREVKQMHDHHCPECPGDCPAGEVMAACKAVENHE